MSIKVAIGPSSFAEEDDSPLRMLKEAGAEIVPNPFGRRLSEEEIIHHLQGVDGLLAGLEPLNRRVLSAAPQLKAIARVGIGMNNVDIQSAAELGIKVSNTPEGPTAAVAEMTLSALLTLCRRLLPANAALHAGKWEKSIGMGLQGAKVLIVGYGRIGRRVGQLLTAFGAEVLVTDPVVTREMLKNGEVLVSLSEGLQQAQVVTLHSSGAEIILGENEFALMQPGVILLNSARGELVDEDALVRALEGKIISGAWFDTFWEEPYKGKLTQFEQVLLTPHMSTYTKQCRLSMETDAVKNLLRDLL